ncbi:hypothetical protein AbraIFM66950_009791 [Aspergillus brasiliensis]|nr:hypothetical protein AbraIFM66950_009791 [Aspergillus brasiliensis]
MTIGRFAFQIKHGEPQEHRDELWKLWDINVDKFTYEDIPEHLRVYEFTPEEYAELEREEAQPITNWGTYNEDEDMDKDKDEDKECLPVKP